MTIRSLAALLPAMLACLGCEGIGPDPVEVSPREVTPAMLAGAALAAFQANGRFALTHPEPAEGEITLATARERSLQFAKYVTNELLLRGVIEAGRGGYWTDPHLLVLCSDAYFVRSQLEPFDPQTLPSEEEALVRRWSGSQWLIPLCGSGGEPQMTVQVAVDGNDVVFHNNEPVSPYYSLSTAYYGRGVPFRWPDALPISAERAVRFVFDQLGVRIAEVPELHVRGGLRPDSAYDVFGTGMARSCNRWRIVLEHEVALRGLSSGVTRSAREIYVGSLTCGGNDIAPLLQLPLEQQPSDVAVIFYDTSTSPFVSYEVRTGLAAPIEFEMAEGLPPA